jgi:hypothetical protein
MACVFVRVCLCVCAHVCVSVSGVLVCILRLCSLFASRYRSITTEARDRTLVVAAPSKESMLEWASVIREASSADPEVRRAFIERSQPGNVAAALKASLYSKL